MASYEPLNPGDKVSARWAYEELRRIAAVLDELEAADTTIEAAVDALETLVPPIVWIPAQSFVAVLGTPVIGTAGGGRRHVFLFDAAASETIETNLAIPIGWSSFSTVIYWVNAGAGAGSVTWNLQGIHLAEGSSINAADNINNAVDFTEAAGAQDVIVETPCGNFTGLTAGRYLSLRVGRDGPTAADTLGNDAGFLGVKLTKSN